MGHVVCALQDAEGLHVVCALQDAAGFTRCVCVAKLRGVYAYVCVHAVKAAYYCDLPVDLRVCNAWRAWWLTIYTH